jgi:4'-phosphopantetheinyl transferase
VNDTNRTIQNEGVDLERLRPMPDALDLATQYFYPWEIRVLRQQDPAPLAAAFLSAWTRKESYVKAVGGGLSMPLSNFHAEIGSGAFRRWIVNSNSLDENDWFVGDLSVGQDHVAHITFSKH